MKTPGEVIRQRVANKLVALSNIKRAAHDSRSSKPSVVRPSCALRSAFCVLRVACCAEPAVEPTRLAASLCVCVCVCFVQYVRERASAQWMLDVVVVGRVARDAMRRTRPDEIN